MDIDKIAISDKFKHSDKGFKYFIGYTPDNIIRPFCIILPQMSGYIKHFDDNGKNMSFATKDDIVLVKYNKIWNKIKKILNIKFHELIYDEKYIKPEVKAFKKVQFFQKIKFQKKVFITFVQQQ